MTTKIFEPKINCSGSSGDGDGVDTFIELTDTPDSYDGQENKTVVVNSTGNGLTFVDSPSGGDGNSNVFKINAGETYTVESNQELVSTGLFYLDGEMVLDGKWALLGESVTQTGSFGDIGGDDDHTHSDLVVLAEMDLLPNSQGGYIQNIYHTLQGFPLLKFITSDFREVHPVVRHINTGHFVIESNVPLTGKIYALHSTQTRVPVQYGALNLQPVGDEFVQLIYHNTNSFPFFKIMDGNGSELMLEVEHITRFITKIKSNIAVSGQIYML